MFVYVSACAWFTLQPRNYARVGGRPITLLNRRSEDRTVTRCGTARVQTVHPYRGRGGDQVLTCLGRVRRRQGLRQKSPTAARARFLYLRTQGRPASCLRRVDELTQQAVRVYGY